VKIIFYYMTVQEVLVGSGLAGSVTPAVAIDGIDSLMITSV
jgi:hypothetical protein